MWRCLVCNYLSNPIAQRYCTKCKIGQPADLHTVRPPTPLVPESASAPAQPLISSDVVNLWLTMPTLLCPVCKQSIASLWPSPLVHLEQCKQKSANSLSSTMSLPSKRLRNDLYDWTCLCTLRIINASKDDIRVHQQNCSVWRSQQSH